MGLKQRKPPGLLAWHFLAADRRLGYSDGRWVEAGKTYCQLDMSREPEPCSYGMHASVRPIDALRYAPGPVVCRVVLSDGVLTEGDKSVARKREVLWLADAEKPLRDFARRCALDVAHLWDMPPIVRRYLESGDESTRAAARAAARDAARNAARAAAWNAAWAAAMAAAMAAAWAAAMAAARDAARNAAWNAARAVARAAYREKQNRDLEAALTALAPEEWRGV